MPEEDNRTTAGKRSWRSVFWFLVGFVTGPIIFNAGFILLGYFLAPHVQNMDHAEQAVRCRLYDYLTHEGHKNRGPRFRSLVGTLDNMRWEKADMSRETVTAYLGTPDLSHDQGNAVHLGYHYRDEQNRERVAVVTFRDGRLVSVGYGDLPAGGPGRDK